MNPPRVAVDNDSCPNATVIEGLKLELSPMDRMGVLREVTHIFCKHSLTVTSADISSEEGKVICTFYVRDIFGDIVDIVDQERIEAIRKKLSQSYLVVTGQIGQASKSTKLSPIDFLFGGLFRGMS